MVEQSRQEIEPQAGSRLRCRGVRGATVATENSVEAILSATRELLYALVRVNGIRQEDVASVYFTTTRDLNAAYPATAARQLGWFDAALLCGHEMEVPNSLPRCIRILLHWNTSRAPGEITHVYLNEASALRPDRENTPPIPAEELRAVREMSGGQLDIFMPGMF